MLDKRKFRAKLMENGYTYASMAKEIGISERTFTNRIKKLWFGSDEIEKMIPLLKIENPKEIFLQVR